MSNEFTLLSNLKFIFKGGQFSSLRNAEIQIISRFMKDLFHINHCQ